MEIIDNSAEEFSVATANQSDGSQVQALTQKMQQVTGWHGRTGPRGPGLQRHAGRRSRGRHGIKLEAVKNPGQTRLRALAKM